MKKYFLLLLAVLVGVPAITFASPIPIHIFEGELVKAPGLSTVYRMGVDGGLHAFPNSVVYFSWYRDYTSIRTLDGLASYTFLGKNVTFKKGVVFKLPYSPKVYETVSDDGLVTWITDLSSKGYQFSDIKDLPEAFWPGYRDANDADEKVVNLVYNGSYFDSVKIFTVNNQPTNHYIQVLSDGTGGGAATFRGTCVIQQSDYELLNAAIQKAHLAAITGEDLPFSPIPETPGISLEYGTAAGRKQALTIFDITTGLKSTTNQDILAVVSKIKSLGEECLLSSSTTCTGPLCP